MSSNSPRAAGDWPSRAASPRSKAKPTACRRCHSRKVKCSGGEPCRACAGSGRSAECSYPDRDRFVKVSQRYINDLLAENRRLRRDGGDAQAEQRLGQDHAAAGSASSAAAAAAVTVTAHPALGEERQGPTRNPLFEDRPWFLHVSASNDPLLIGEAADSAFVTRFRQTLTGAPLNHTPRTAYPSDAEIHALAASPCALPSPERARFLLMAALRTATSRYYIVLRSAAMDGLEKLLAHPTSDDIPSCKIWALLALGEVYSTRMASAHQACPGLAYFAQASRVLHTLHERPCMDLVETFLLLAIYSMLAHRRQTASCLAGWAVRNSVIIGLHLDIPEAQLSDTITREHRKRLWWAVYEIDRYLSTSLGQPTGIQDDDIHLEMPADCGSPDSGTDCFTDAEYLKARIALTRLSGRITRSLYGRRSQDEPFSYRVQQALKDLRGWVHGLPDCLQLDSSSSSSQSVPERIRSLHLAFNQAVMVATRPVLLYCLRAHKDVWQNQGPRSPEEPQLPETVQAIAGACIRCARHTYRLLLDAWVDGTFTTFDYPHIQYLFSTASILAVSSLLRGHSHAARDGEDFDHALELLADLKRSGNPTAYEFCLHLAALKENMRDLERASGGPNEPSTNPPSFGSQAMGGVPTVTAYPALDPSYTTSFMTAEMALAEPSLQAFLTQTDVNLQLMDRSILDNGSAGFYLGP